MKEKYTLEDLAEIIRTLRAEGGCPWDREQTHETLREAMLEEAYEAADAIDKGGAVRGGFFSGRYREPALYDRETWLEK